MIKFTNNNDWDHDIPSVSVLYESNQLVKRASAKHLLKYSKTKGQTDLHMIALGAYEGTGSNRNEDLFLEEDCINNHHYFKDSDRAVHRHHKNKKKDPKYGNIKASAYNHPMKRIELIVGLDDDKCQDILHEQEKTGSTDWSMASKQQWDRCTWCNHKATSDEDRCEHIPTKLGEINKLGIKCSMINDNPKWFEISYVKRGADRIGKSLRKLAGADVLKPMLTRDYLALYPGFEAPDDSFFISKKASDKRGLLTKLAEMEKQVHAAGKGSYLSHAKKLSKSEGLSDQTIDELRKYEPHKLLKALADKGIILNPGDFSHYMFGDKIKDENVNGMKTHLPHALSDMDDRRDDVVNNEKFEPSMHGALPPDAKKLIENLFEGHSLFGGPAARRVMRITIIAGGPMDKEKPEEKTKEAFDKELALQYCAYKLAALNYLNENDKLDDELMMNAVIQNIG